MKNLFYYEFKPCNLNKLNWLCRLGIAEENGAVCNIFFSTVKKQDGYNNKETPLIKETAKQLDEYFSKKRKNFDIPLLLRGTKFQMKVWNTLKEIPYGETRSYKELAEMTGNPKASRAVGMANNRNPLPIIIPCHRIIGSDGSLTGYAGGLELKQKLLELERDYLKNLPQSYTEFRI
ncbi:MAG: methylated-DNA--[protein]-cysteine S-methyltransferase [Treponema sp.]|jgi:methylated-DNA-[protein]-cysteine S-methyltransferase|nr:methylated-DNA--[protein]-cysteine S-methyltransferase [Treponema sp.]